MYNISDLDFVFRIFLALIIGGFIGLERQFRNRHAGIRTFAVLCMASALLSHLALVSSHSLESGNVPQAILAVVLSMGFLGAGVIYREKNGIVIIHGLTTATTLLMTSTIGLALGLGFIKYAIIVFVFTVISLTLFRKIELKTGLKKIIVEEKLRE